MTAMRKTTIAIAIAVLAASGTVATASEHGKHERGRDRRGEREDDGRGRSAPVAPADAEGRALYRKECGACHLDFPPGFLPAESHRRIMAGLERHFGQNAELDPAVRDRVERYLVENAAEARSARKSQKVLGSLAGAAPLRITEVPWFERKHRRIDASVAARPTVRSRANCAACHAGAADWDFDDDRVKIPAS
jgi:Dihaem cytochrome c